jgi:tetraacyldisaccharide 4'-kinase
VSLLSSIYGAVTQGRTDLYDRGLLKTHRLSQPVVSVGNLSVGGSGKTPFVILLGEMLKARDIRFDVLSRGYGRHTRGVLAVDPNGSPDDFGDEPILIARRLGCPVVVADNRYEAGVFAEKQFSSQLHILDDGFQHRALARDFDIVLLTPEDVCDRLLPAGRLREPLASLRRAHAVVLAGEIELKDLPVSGKNIWRLRRGVSITNSPEQPAVFCGIARPQKFLEQLRGSGIHETAIKLYRDHHRYSERDVRELIELRNRSRAGGFITTEKDATNLGPLLAQLGQVAIAQVTMQLEKPDTVVDTLLRVIGERRAQA